jgi:hypothetical protein
MWLTRWRDARMKMNLDRPAYRTDSEVSCCQSFNVRCAHETHSLLVQIPSSSLRIMPESILHQKMLALLEAINAFDGERLRTMFHPDATHRYWPKTVQGLGQEERTGDEFADFITSRRERIASLEVCSAISLL